MSQLKTILKKKKKDEVDLTTKVHRGKQMKDLVRTCWTNLQGLRH